MAELLQNRRLDEVGAPDGGIAYGDSRHQTVSSGKGGIIMLKYFDGERDRIRVGYIGESGLKPNVPYGLDKKRLFVGVNQ